MVEVSPKKTGATGASARSALGLVLIGCVVASGACALVCLSGRGAWFTWQQDASGAELTLSWEAPGFIPWQGSGAAAGAQSPGSPAARAQAETGRGPIAAKARHIPAKMARRIIGQANCKSVATPY